MSLKNNRWLYFFTIIFFLFFNLGNVYAQITPPPVPPPVQTDDFSLSTSGNPPVCPKLNPCPADLAAVYPAGQSCATSYDVFKANPTTSHYWVEDPKVTAQGKADERARQFIYWVVSKNSIDSHPVLTNIWSNTRNVSYFFTIFIAAIMGLGLIIGQRGHFETKLKIWPQVWKILGSLLFITFSAAIVLTLIQLSEITMKFFVENLGGKDVFNIYFGSISKEQNYIDFVGCRDLNYRVQESVGAELFLLKLTNITYYVMGSMLILRKILLWFLLFVAPFIALLFPFTFIRNIAWVWIGVFFQWLFYGPLFALFLGGMSTIWRIGIPYPFDFSRVGKPEGYVYPTAINILYGGPAQKLGSSLANGNYIDTFVEYVVTLIMLWAVTFFPWLLLRIFRDYCCDGINATKNIAMSIYEQIRSAPPPPPTSPAPTPSQTTMGSSLNISKQTQTEALSKIKLETIEEIKKVKSEDISRSLNLSATKLTDIAHIETNRQINETFRKNIDYLSNPIKATTPVERQKFMNIRTELTNRAIKEDKIAKQILSATSVSKYDNIQKKQEILKSIPKPAAAASTAPGQVPAQTQKNIEKTVQIPPSVSLEDYEQVKKMWQQQYEKGEVPVTENITSRHQWVEQDVVFVTNALNKLVSADETVRMQGLDDIAYILPVFLINNLSGEELMVYLKAKLEAAKDVITQMDKEKEITEKLKIKSQEETVVVEKPKNAPVEKTMEMKNEIS